MTTDPRTPLERLTAVLDVFAGTADGLRVITAGPEIGSGWRPEHATTLTLGNLRSIRAEIECLRGIESIHAECRDIRDRDVQCVIDQLDASRAEIERLHTELDYWRDRARASEHVCWDDTVPPGGEVCATCGTPVESEPCPEHSPDGQIARLTAELTAAHKAKTADVEVFRAALIRRFRSAEPQTLGLSPYDGTGIVDAWCDVIADFHPQEG